MKQMIAVLLCLLLSSCSWQTPAIQPETVPDMSNVPAMAGLYDPDHPLENSNPGLIRVYPLHLENVQGIRAFGKDVLVLSGQNQTKLTLFAGDELLESASLTLDFSLDPEDPSLQIHQDSISFFDSARQETVLLDQQLREIRRIAAPAGLSGTPILSPNQDTLYYCTSWAVMAWNLDSGIRRTVKELSYEKQALTALHLDGQILECRVQNNGVPTKMLLSADQGKEVKTLPSNATLDTMGNRYFAAFTEGHQTLLIFGSSDTGPQLLLPDQNWKQEFYLPEDRAAVTYAVSNGECFFQYYELNTGILRASLSLKDLEAPKSIVNTKGHAIYILAHDSETQGDILCRWDVLRQPPDPANITAYKTDYRGPDNPDEEALAKCQEYAEIISEKYGITVHILEDAVSVQPWDYRFEPEYLAPVLQKELTLLDQRLATYPETILPLTKSHFPDLHICLVRQIIGTDSERSLDSATGIQFFDDKEAYVVITTGKYSEQALYHELYHVMETHLLTETSALDPWESLNPTGFVYGSSQPNAEIYLQGQTRAFVDRYSMSALKEDRARFLENAMLQGKEELFRSEYMQRKLTALCVGLREAYGLKKFPETLPWEQYLINSLVPKA